MALGVPLHSLVAEQKSVTGNIEFVFINPNAWPRTSCANPQ